MMNATEIYSKAPQRRGATAMPTAFRGTRSSLATERRQLWLISTLAPVKHNGRSRVYRVLFASRSAFDGCRKVDVPCQSCQRGGGLTQTGRSRLRDRAPRGLLTSCCTDVAMPAKHATGPRRPLVLRAMWA